MGDTRGRRMVYRTILESSSLSTMLFPQDTFGTGYRHGHIFATYRSPSSYEYWYVPPSSCNRYCSAFEKPPNIAFPTLQAGDKTYNVISKLADVLERIETFPPISSPKPHIDVLTTNNSPSFKPPTESPVRSYPVTTPSLPRVQQNVNPVTPPRVGIVDVSVSPPKHQSQTLSPTKLTPTKPFSKYQPPLTRSKSRRYQLRSTRGTNFKSLATQYVTAQLVIDTMYHHSINRILINMETVNLWMRYLMGLQVKFRSKL